MEQLPDSFDELCEALAALDTRADTAAFLRDACTLSELEAIGHRLAVARLLDAGGDDLRGDRARRRHVHHHRHPRRPLAAARQGGYRIALDRLAESRLMRPLRIALPSKGRMAEPAQRLLRDAGFEFEPDGRRLRVPLPDQDAEILFARADDIPVWVDGPAPSTSASPARTRSPSPASMLDERAAARLRALPARARRAGRRRRSPSPGDLAGVPRSRRRTRATVSRYLAGARHRRRPASRSPARSSSRRRWTRRRRSSTSSRAARRCARTACVELETLLESQAVLIAPRELDPASSARVAELSCWC